MTYKVQLQTKVGGNLIFIDNQNKTLNIGFTKQDCDYNLLLQDFIEECQIRQSEMNTFVIIKQCFGHTFKVYFDLRKQPSIKKLFYHIMKRLIVLKNLDKNKVNDFINDLCGGRRVIVAKVILFKFLLDNYDINNNNDFNPDDIDMTFYGFNFNTNIQTVIYSKNKYGVVENVVIDKNKYLKRCSKEFYETNDKLKILRFLKNV